MIDRSSWTRLRGSLVALAMGPMFLLASFVGTPTQAATIGTTIVASATTLRHDDAISGVLPGTQPMHIVVALRLRNHDQLDRFLAASLKTDATRRTMSREEFTARHAPTPVQAQAVRNYLALMGFSNIVISPSRMLVSADGTADTARAAFLTSFVRLRTREGRTAYANNSDAQIPLALKGSVLSVIGLQNVYQAHTFARLAQPRAGAGTLAITGHNPLEFPSIYGGTGVPTAAGVTVGILTEGKLTQTIVDLNTFTANSGLATVVTQTVNTNGSGTDTSAFIEWNLDSQSIVGMAGGQVGKIIFYNVPTFLTTDLTANIDAVVTANVAKIINVSLGVCETAAQADGSAAAEDALFQVAVAQGQTFAVATGDSGADECKNGTTTPWYPASSPYVVAVGGTTLDASTTTYAGETVWIKAGGSPSTFEPKPSWQSIVVPGTKRGTPDLAFDGDPNSGAKIILNGSLVQAGGTSLAAPLFAGAWARLLAAHPTLGFAAPYLYQNLTSVDYHDITAGNNGGEAAAVGWDFASGFGSFILGNVNTDFSPASLSIADMSVSEGNSGTKLATFTVTLSKPSTTAVTYNITTADGTATAGSDYFAKSLTGETIAAGQTSRTFTVTINGDTSVESDETFLVNLSAAAGATIADSQAIGTILNDDQPVLLSIADLSVGEGNNGTTVATFTINLSAAASTPVTYNIATADGTAKAGSDYVARSLTGETIAAGQTSRTFTVTINGDTSVEPNETFLVNLSAAAGAAIADNQAIGTIVNDDQPVLSIADLSVGEGNTGTSVATFTINLSAATSTPVTYDIATANGTATAGSDYVARTLAGETIPAGQTSKTFAVNINGDNTIEPNEIFNVNITHVGGATSGKTQAVGTILNDDGPLLPSLSIADASIVEGNGGTSMAMFTVKLSKPYAIAVTYNIATANGTATAASDYVATPLTTQTIPAGQASKTLMVPINGDATVEPNETFLVNLSAAVGATIARNQATGTIVNDDGPNLSIANVSVAEGASGTKAMTFTVNLSPASASAVTYNIATTDGSAIAGSDYVANTLVGETIPAGQASKTFTVTINGDATVEPNEMFFVDLSAASGATIATSRAVGTIANDDGPTLSITDASVSEGNSGTKTMTFTVNLSQVSASAVTYYLATADGTAIAGSDYVATSSLKPESIAAGQTSKTFAVPINGDTSVEANETFFVNLSAASGASIVRSQAIGTILNDD